MRPETRALSASLMASVSPARVFTTSVDPSDCSMVPRTRTGGGCWASAAVAATIARNAGKTRLARLMFGFLAFVG